MNRGITGLPRTNCDLWCGPAFNGLETRLSSGEHRESYSAESSLEFSVAGGS